MIDDLCGLVWDFKAPSKEGIHTSEAAYVLTLVLRAMSTRPAVASRIMAARPWGLPQLSIMRATGSLRTPDMTEATMPMVGMRECDENSLTT